jgi:uncharacterized protein
VQSNFYPVFAFLFGISMSFIFKGAVQRGLSPYLVFTRRLLFLLCIGAVHAFLLWYGDILVVYALLGFILLPFYRLATKTIFMIGAAIYVVPNALYAFFLFLTNEHLTPSDDLQVIQGVISHYHGGLAERFHQNLADWLLQYNIQTLPFIFISIFPMFLFGLAISKSGYLLKIKEPTTIPDKLWIGAGIIGLTLKCLPIFNPGYLLFSHLAESFGGPLMGLFYALTIIKISPKLQHLQNGLSHIGRMSMTNYLFQSFMGFTIFKLFGLYGEIAPSLNIVVAIFIVILQIYLSRSWLKSHQFGPIEGIWRKVTYGELQSNSVKTLKI